MNAKDYAYVKLNRAREGYANLVKKARYDVADADPTLVCSVMEEYLHKLDSARNDIIRCEGMVEAFKMMEENE